MYPELVPGAKVRLQDTAKNCVTVLLAVLAGSTIHLNVLDIFGRTWWLPFPSTRLFILE